jgi:hypothetical protein
VESQKQKKKKGQGKKGSLRELERGQNFVERGAALCFVLPLFD